MKENFPKGLYFGSLFHPIKINRTKRAGDLFKKKYNSIVFFITYLNRNFQIFWKSCNANKE